jgi:hypothetical protein
MAMLSLAGGGGSLVAALCVASVAGSFSSFALLRTTDPGKENVTVAKKSLKTFAADRVRAGHCDQMRYL